MDFLADNPLLCSGLAAALVAVLAWLGDRRQLRRADLDRVGLVPWQGLAFWTSLAAALLLAGAWHDWWQGG